MTERAQKIYEEAMTLPDDERAALADQLNDSLPMDPAWIAEITRRAERAPEAPEAGTSWEEVKQRLQTRFVRP